MLGVVVDRVRCRNIPAIEADFLSGVQVPVEAREIAAADLEAQSMTWMEYVAGRPKVDYKFIGLAWIHEFRGFL